MKILSIDTASNLCTVALLENKTCVKELIVNDARNHSEKIMPLIEQLFTETNSSLKNIDLIVCDKWPGSFTGIRIGTGTVLAFRDSLNIDCIGISSLEALAYNTSSEGLICSLIDAKNNNVYYGLFELKNGVYSKIGDFSFKNINDIVLLLNTYSEPITFVGDGAVSYKNFITSNFKNCNFCEKNDLSSYSLGCAGFDNYNKGIKDDIMPLYLRKSQAERALEEKGR